MALSKEKENAIRALFTDKAEQDKVITKLSGKGRATGLFQKGTNELKEGITVDSIRDRIKKYDDEVKEDTQKTYKSLLSNLEYLEFDELKSLIEKAQEAQEQKRKGYKDELERRKKELKKQRDEEIKRIEQEIKSLG